MLQTVLVDSRAEKLPAKKIHVVRLCVTISPLGGIN